MYNEETGQSRMFNEETGQSRMYNAETQATLDTEQRQTKQKTSHKNEQNGSHKKKGDELRCSQMVSSSCFL